MTLRNDVGTLLATSDPVKWVINDPATFTRNYNSLNPSNTKQEDDFTQFFYIEGTPVFNKDRAVILNSKESYPTKEVYDINAKTFYDRGIPGLKDPKTGLNINSKGRSTKSNVIGFPPTSNVLKTDDTTLSQFRENPNSFVLSTSGTAAKALSSLSGSTVMRYPLFVSDSESYDYIQIRGHQYKAPGISGALIGGNRLGEETGVVVLPMHQGLSESNGAGWNRGDLNAIQAALLNTAGAGIEALSNDIMNVGGSMQAMIQTLMSKGKGLLSEDGNAAFIKAYFAGKAVGVPNLTSRSTGQVINPNMEMLYESPSMRSFTFTWNLTPRDSDESSVIKEMIRWFKLNMVPHVTKSSLYLYAPNIFQLEYMYNGGSEHPYLNKFKPCALIKFDVDYNPIGKYMTYDDGGMISYTINATFSELVPIYDKDQEQAGGTGY
jgi:hypothetical protein